MQKSIKNKPLAITAVVIAGIGIVTGACIIATKMGANIPVVSKLIGDSADSSDANRKGTYIAETCYDGSNPVYKQLFQIPFQKTEDYYIMNKTLYAEHPERVTQLMDEATDFIETMLGTGYREVTTEGYSYKDTMMEYIDTDINDSLMLDDGTRTTPEDYFEDLGKLIEEHEIQADVTFETDKSLVYEDGYYYVRGVLTIEPYAFTGDEDTNLLPEGISLKDGGSYIFEVSLKNMSPASEVFYVTQYYWLANLSSTATAE